jgi:hypothetical protein
MKKAALIQSNYLPWKGYFDIIHDVDVFVFVEDVQYTRKDWRNRNKIKTRYGTEWISVPVVGGVHQKICETRINYSKNWINRHKALIKENYVGSEYFEAYKEDIFEIYNHNFETLSELNIYAVKKICKILDINTELINSTTLNTHGTKDDKIIEICNKIGADVYLSGPAAKVYIVDEKFERAGITLEYKDYSGYPQYSQLWGEFDHFFSIIDIIFNCGDKAPYYIWDWRKKSILKNDSQLDLKI